MYQLLRARSEGLRRNCISFAQNLVRTPSPSFNESAVAALIQDELRAVGFPCVTTDSFGNVVGVLEGRESEPTVLLTGHMDTVSAGEERAWTRHPFDGAIEGGRLHGLGAGDCKAGLAGMVYAAAALNRSLLPLRGTLVVAATVAEEQGGSVGVRGLLEKTLPGMGLEPTYAVLAEPTGLGLYYGHDGWLELEIAVEGERRVRVDEAAWAIFDDFSVLDKQKRRSGVPELSSARPPAFSGTNGSHRATIRLDRRMRSPEDAEEVVGQVQHHAALAIKNMEAVAVAVAVRQEKQRLYTGRPTTLRRLTNAWGTDPFHPLMEKARRSLGAAGCTVRAGTWQLGRLGMGTAGGVLVDEFGIPTIGYGPGDEAAVHAPNEWVATDSITEAVYGTAAVVQGIIGVPVLAWTTDAP